MQSDFEGAAWAANHAALSHAIAEFIDKIAYAFERLNAIEYDAPWHRIPPTEKALPQSCPN